MKHIGGSIQLAATDVASLSSCAHLVALEVDVLNKKRVRPQAYSSVTQRLMYLGDEHEKRYLAKLCAAGNAVEDLPAKISDDEASAKTLDAMRRGLDVIYQGVLRGDGWFGRTDFLVKVTHPSKLGDYSYEVIDTKLSQEPKGRALLQLCLYSHLLEAVQGHLPDEMHIVLGDDTRASFSTRSYMAYFRRVARDVRGAVAVPEASTYPTPCDHCEICPWIEQCDKRRRDDDDLCIVAGLTSRQRDLFLTAGVRTVAALGALPSTKKLEDISPASLARVREQARLQCEGRKQKKVIHELIDETEADRGLLLLPTPSKGDLFVDIEGDPVAMKDGIEYLIGLTDGKDRYVEFWGIDRAKEKRAFEGFMRFVAERRKVDPSLNLYHYGAYELSAFKRLACRHGACVEELDELLRGKVFVDLLRAVRQGIRASVESYSIKKLEPLYSFERKADLKDAGSCLVAMATWLDRRATPEPSDELRKTIAEYNADDCLSTHALRDWLEVQRDVLEKKTKAPLARPGGGYEASEELSEAQARVRALQERLVGGIPEDEGARSPTQQGTWLLAQLVDWHRREGKSAWWEYFRLVELSDEELLEDRSALGGLEFVGVVGKEKRSTLYKYRFPPQEHAIAQAEAIHDPRTRKSAGALHEFDDVACTLTLKHAQKVPTHPTAIIPASEGRSGVLKEALLRLGDWTADNGIESKKSDFKAERALLTRMTPRIPSGVTIRSGLSSKEIEALGCDLALAVDGSVLPVQGPPGAGKTHLGARMIVALVKAGRRVGIVANSHKVIGKLLKDACVAAEEAGQTLRCVRKPGRGSEDEAPIHKFVTNVFDNDGVLPEIEAGANVIAGTVYLWAREEMTRVVDVLFVDEAGQLSLANVLAAAQAANGIVMLGDPQQLDQPLKGVHPSGAEASALGHVLGEHATLSPEHGLFLPETWRMHPEICSYISEVFYDGKLHSKDGLEKQRVNAKGILGGTGLRFVPAVHHGNANESIEEADLIATLIAQLLAQKPTWVDRNGETHDLGPEGVLVITPYNAQVATIRTRVPAGVHVGTVDKFQGQEAPIAIYSFATSSSAEAPRGMEFLYSKNRLNVAISRAKCVSVVVASPELFRVDCKTPGQMELANAVCRFAEVVGAHSKAI